MGATSTVRAMNSTANEQVLTALQQVVGATLKNWLDENKAEVIQALRAAVPAPQMPPPAAKPAAAEEKRQPQFLNTAELAARWQLHRGERPQAGASAGATRNARGSADFGPAECGHGIREAEYASEPAVTSESEAQPPEGPATRRSIGAQRLWHG